MTVKVPLPITENICGWFWQVKKNFLFAPTWERVWISANESDILCYDTPYQQNLILKVSRSDVKSVVIEQFDRDEQQQDVFVFKCTKNDELLLSHGDETEKRRDLWAYTFKC